MANIITGFKGFNKDLTCNGFQFKEGKLFKHSGKVELCKSGFHFCENPLDCFTYYAPGGDNTFHLVEAEDVSNETHVNSKRVAAKITVGAALSIKDMVKFAVRFMSSKMEVSGANSATSGNWAHSVTSGNGANSATSGNWAHSVTSGNGANSATSGNGAHSVTSGNWANSATSGNWAHSVTSGNGAHSVTSGNGAHSVTSGDQAHSATSGNWANSVTFGHHANSAALGDYSSAEADSAESVAVVTGRDSKARGAIGGWLVLTERDLLQNIVCVKAVKVDGKKILPGVWYELKSRKIVQASEEK